MKRVVIIILLCSVFVSLQAQKEDNIWCFGNYAGLDFTGGNPVPISNSALFTYDNSSTISDSAGNLLFYTNGEKVWDKNHQTMQNGSALLGSNTGGQAALIVKQPSASTIYYIFTSDAFGASGGLHYSVVDLSLNNGLGALTQKNILLHNPSTEKLAGFFSCSSNVAWLISHKANSDEFYCYAIDSNGINLTPVISAVGSVNPSGQWGVVNNTAGQMTVNKLGDKIASAKYASGTIELFDFDKFTGVVSNGILINGFNNAWGLEFSADGSKLYASQWFSDVITQFDLTINNLPAILSSETVIGNAIGGGGYNAGFMQRGPDDKIYIAKWSSNYLAVVNQPNLLGSNCLFVDNGVSLGSGISSAGLSRVVSNECALTSYPELIEKQSGHIHVSTINNSIVVRITDENFSGKASIEIFDILGQDVVVKSLMIKNGECVIVPNNLSKGAYVLSIETDYSRFNTKIFWN